MFGSKDEDNKRGLDVKKFKSALSKQNTTRDLFDLLQEGILVTKVWLWMYVWEREIEEEEEEENEWSGQ